MRLVIRISMLRLKHFAVLLGRVFTVDEVTFLRPFLHARDETDQICLVGMTGSSLRYGFRRVSRFATLITLMEKSSPSRSSPVSLHLREIARIRSEDSFTRPSELVTRTRYVPRAARLMSFVDLLRVYASVRSGFADLITDGCSETRRLTGFRYRQRAERYRC
jgi:hypothetical protein